MQPLISGFITTGLNRIIFLLIGIIILMFFSCSDKNIYKDAKEIERNSLVKNDIKYMMRYSTQFSDGQKIDSTRRRVLTEYFDRQGRLTYKVGDTIDDRCWRWIYKYSSEGRLLTEIWLTPHPKLFKRNYYRSEYSYNENGTLMSMIRFNPENYIFLSMLYFYDNFKREVSTVLKIGTAYYTFDSSFYPVGQNNVTLKKNILFASEAGSKTEYKYDNLGRTIEESTFDIDNQPIDKKTYYYNSNDLLESETHWDVNSGQPKEIFENKFARYKME